MATRIIAIPSNTGTIPLALISAGSTNPPKTAISTSMDSHFRKWSLDIKELSNYKTKCYVSSATGDIKNGLFRHVVCRVELKVDGLLRLKQFPGRPPE